MNEATKAPLPRIVCAAVRCAGKVICGPRHFDHVMWATILGMSLEDFDKFRQDQLPPPSVSVWGRGEEGFVDQFGTFHSRRDAWDIAEARGQITRDLKCGGGVLYSEHLY